MAGLDPGRGGTGLAVAVARRAALAEGRTKTDAGARRRAPADGPARWSTMSAVPGPAAPAAPVVATRLSGRARRPRPAGAAPAGLRPASEYG
ncbi:hypothetical protein ACFY9A_12055 [Streptomyces rubradiris]|uniref:hypothetical protein n=1 Tax=Streptomyces rubradiris TaxID=285531 RepID=UPI0036F13080